MPRSLFRDILYGQMDYWQTMIVEKQLFNKEDEVI